MDAHTVNFILLFFFVHYVTKNEGTRKIEHLCVALFYFSYVCQILSRKLSKKGPRHDEMVSSLAINRIWGLHCCEEDTTGQRLPVAEEEIVKNGGELLLLHLREP